MGSGRRYTVDGRRKSDVGNRTVDRKQLTVLVVSSVLLISFVTVAIATGFFGINTTKISSLEKGLVGHWMLDAENGAKDLTPYGNHGTAQGGVTIGGAEDRKGKNGGATSFDGTDDYISLDSNLQITSVSMWINLWNVTNVAYFLGDSVNKNGIRYNGYSFLSYSGGSIWDELNWTKVNRMVHLGIVRVDNTGYYDFYVDGIKIGTSYGGNNNNIIIDTIGRRDSQYYFNGSISDVRIYNRALSEDEIKLLYDSYKPKASASDLNKGLVGHWMLDSENGAKDLTPYGNHGTAQGGVTIGGAEDRKGKSGGATSFDGSDDYVEVEDNLNITSQMSLSIWVQAGGAGESQYRPLFVKEDKVSSGNGIGGFGLRIYNAATSLNKGYLAISTQYDTFPINLNSGWHHIAAVVDNTNRKVYIDGFKVVESTKVALSVSTNNNLTIGGVPSSLSVHPGFLNGNISDARIYNRVLSEDEIKLLYDSYKPKEVSVGNLNKGLVLDMPLTTKWMKSSTIVSDRTPYGNDGIVMNGANITNEGAVFDGVDDYVDLGNAITFGTSNFSINTWWKANGSQSSYANILEQGFTNPLNNGAWSFKVSKFDGGNDFSFSYAHSGTIINVNTGFTTMSDGKWHMLSIIREGRQVSLYCDEVKVYNFNFPVDYSLGDGSNIFIGRNPRDKTFIKGSVSNIKFYNRAISDEEVKLLYEKGRW